MGYFNPKLPNTSIDYMKNNRYCVIYEYDYYRSSSYPRGSFGFCLSATFDMSLFLHR